MARIRHFFQDSQPVLVSVLAHLSVLLALACWNISRPGDRANKLSVSWSETEGATELLAVEVPEIHLESSEETDDPVVVVETPEPPVAARQLVVPEQAAETTDWYSELTAPATASRLQPIGAGHGTSLTSAPGSGNGEAAGSGPAEPGEGHPIRFFGAEAYGEKVVFVLDRSGSMEGIKLALLKSEFFNSLERLNEKVLFNVIFFGYRVYERDAEGLRPATSANKEEMLQWVRAVRANESTVVAPAIERALAAEPDVIFFLTDGEFSPYVVGNITRRNEKQIPIHTIGLKNRNGTRVLSELAAQNYGRFTFVP